MAAASPRPWVTGTALLAGLGVLLAPSTAAAWASNEHQELGQASYLRGCAAVTATVAARGNPSADVRERLEIACGRNLAVTAGLYGDATAVAGDFLGHPSDFISHYGAWSFSSKKAYLLLALENSSHFNPMSTRSWGEYHERAVDHALASGGAPGLATVEAFQLAMNESAFADHFLQDSFASGHMGFNRPASSAAAAKAFHDSWNRRGREVSNRNGNRWLTFGDGDLDDPRAQDGREHVTATASMSVGHVLHVFVLRERAPEQELAVWRALPYTIEAPRLLADTAELVTGRDTGKDHQLVPLAGSIRPARKDLVVSSLFWAAAPFDDAGNPIVAGVAGLELAVPFIPAQTYLGVGGTLDEPTSKHSMVLDTGLLFPLLLSVDGLISHELHLTASWLFWSDLTVVLHGEYQLNVELGNVVASLQVGLAGLFPDPRPGWYGGLSLGYVFSAAGGGTF